MTPAAVNTDNRMVIAGLVANGAAVRPALITATGRAAPSRFAVLPPGAWVPFALLPHVDYIDDPDRRPGGGFVGGRQSCIAPWLKPGAVPAAASLGVTLRALPASGDDILRELRARSGLWSAPGALFARAAWTDASVATWLDRLRVNGDDARLSTAHLQGSFALRKMWMAVEWNVGSVAGVPLVTASGAVAVGRALIDVVAIVDRLATPAKSETQVRSECEAALEALLTALHHYLRHLRAAEAAGDPDVMRHKLSRAIVWARTILDAVGVFSVTSDAPRKRWQRLSHMLEGKASRDHAGGAASKLEQISRELECLACANLGARLERTGWRPHIRRALLRLAMPDRERRMSGLARIRCDLIFALAMSRQLDRIYRLFPWLAAPHGAFPGCAGGALGALASLYESSRGVDIGNDMKRRLVDTDQGPGTVRRMTVRAVSGVYANPRHIVLAAGRNYAAGAALAAQVTSHVMVKAALYGQHFGGGLSLEATRGGFLGYNDVATFKLKRTRDAVVVIQQAQPAFEVTARDDDLIRHMGLTLVRHLGAMVRAIWPTSFQRGDFVIHRAMIHFGRKPRKNGDRRADADGPWDAFSKHRIHQELVRSMLLTLDGGVGSAGSVRNAITDIATPPSDDGEYARAARMRERASRTDGAYEEHDEGQGGARAAGKEATNAGNRGQILRDLVDDMRRWRPVDPRKPQPAPQDDLLEDILRGYANLAQLAPVSDLFVPILWFAPLIDRDRLAWIARGMPGQASADDDTSRAAKLKSWLDGVRRWSSAPFAGPIVTGREDVVACHLFTGVSPVTADLGHVR
ncbi:hypothetical protein JW805_03105 [Roseomonas aeriglobus]|nr:hypothetical protein [Roseomonas aeriglobus]